MEKAYPQYVLKPDLPPIHGYFDNGAATILMSIPAIIVFAAFQ